MNKIDNTIIYSYNSGISRIVISDPANYNALSFKTIKSMKDQKNTKKDQIENKIRAEIKKKILAHQERL